MKILKYVWTENKKKTMKNSKINNINAIKLCSKEVRCIATTRKKPQKITQKVNTS